MLLGIFLSVEVYLGIFILFYLFIDLLYGIELVYILIISLI